MPTADVIAFLSLIVALSAYLAVFRTRILDKIKNASATDRSALIWQARLLTLADAPMITAAVCLFFFGFWDTLVGGPAPRGLRTASIYFFAFAGIVMICYHIYAWIRAFFDQTGNRMGLENRRGLPFPIKTSPILPLTLRSRLRYPEREMGTDEQVDLRQGENF